MRGPLLRQHIISVLYFDDITHEGDVHETPVPHRIRDRILFVSSEKYLLRQIVLVYLLCLNAQAAACSVMFLRAFSWSC
jgi:hypothetical protein